MSNITPKGADTVRIMLAENKERFQTALGKAIEWDYFLRCCMTQIEQTPKLMECSKTSLLSALVTAAQLRLVPDGQLGHAYLVPYKGKATFIPGYKGLRELVLRAGKVRDLRARVVYKNDKFKFAYGLVETLEHEPNMEDRGDPIAVYAVADYIAGGHAITVMSKQEIEEHKEQYSKSWNYDDSAWQTAPDRMWEKTALRRLSGRLEMSVEAQRAVTVSERYDKGLDLDTGEVIDIDPPTPDTSKTKIDNLMNKIKKKDESNGNGAAAEEEESGQQSIEGAEDGPDLTDARTAVNDHLAALFKNDTKAKQDGLKLIICKVAPNYNGDVTTADQLPDNLVLPVLDCMLENK